MTTTVDIDEVMGKFDGLVDDLTYSCAVYNIEHCGMTWDGIKQLFPDNGGLMEARYKAENLCNE